MRVKTGIDPDTGPIGHEEARGMLSRFVYSATTARAEWVGGKGVMQVSHVRQARISIPANPRHDDDLRLAAYISQCEQQIIALSAVADKAEDLLRNLTPIMTYEDQRKAADALESALATLREPT